jgi:hypothetical protein
MTIYLYFMAEYHHGKDNYDLSAVNGQTSAVFKIGKTEAQ